MRCRLLLLLCVFLGQPACLRAAEPAHKPNVIVILIDDLGWTDLGCYGSDLYETPNLDRLAKQGTRFTQGYSACTVCSPTRAALMTGKYPARLHVTDWIHGSKRPFAKLAIPKWTEYLPREEVTIAEALKQAGYATGHIGKWHLGDKNEGYPDQHGFDVNLGGCERGQPPSYFSPYKLPTLEEGPKGEYLTDREAAEACRFIEQHKDKPFFLYLPHYAVHRPLQAKKELIDKFTKKIKPELNQKDATYAAMVASMDEAAGTIMAKLDDLKIAERTVIFFTSDNGGLVLGNTTSNVPLRVGKGSSYEGGVRVPFIVKWPGTTKPGSICHTPVMTIDLYRTILEITGARGDEKHNAKVDGISLVPVLKDANTEMERASLYWHYPHYHPGGATPYGAVRVNDWKLIEWYEDHRVELYNLKADIGEKNDLAAMEPDKVKDLRDRLHAWRKAVGAQMPTPNPDHDPVKDAKKK